MTSRAESILVLVAFLAATFFASALGAFVTVRQLPGWYAELQKPSWTPPGWVFTQVWTVLYAMIAVAAWRLWRKNGLMRDFAPFAWWLFQLILNAGWSAVFFGLRQPGMAMGELVFLWASIAMTMVMFWKRDRLAGALLVPYLAWTTFAGVLNFVIWRMNS